ncbi:epoxyqueuosine reductase QueH [Erysipelothrix urinaevulpis]|uniref:epoxyqueuosine reductase QueH n=1 Tax=Erysipelothrix urinaevulpis TaxID=2683717 RepID=UPI001358F523|nr:epoxyqueuosine reductase QueH [Erysipelothrix urinaevulpis]
MITHEKIETLLKGNKVNYDKELQSLFKEWKTTSTRPKILLHSCCAPCSTYSLEYLCEYADVCVYFSNSNIYPRSEYQRRSLVQKNFIQKFNDKTGHDVLYIEADYKPNEFIEMVHNQKLEQEPEGGKRCTACFDMRLNEVAKAAQSLGYDYFGTALTLSPHKDAQVVNAVGYEVQKIYDVSYLPADFKKQGGFYRSVEMCDEYDIYRQCYCGCIFAAKQQGIDLKDVNKEALEFIKSQDTGGQNG